MRSLLLIILITSLCSCAPRRPAQVDEVGVNSNRTQNKLNNTSSSPDGIQTTHRVVKGDSLYSIGFRYQKDYKTLAAINNINPPYRIYPNQILKLTGSTKQSNKVVFKPGSKTTNNDVVQTKPITSNQPITATTEPLKDSQQPETQTITQSGPTTTSEPVVKAPTIKVPQSNKPPAKKPLPVTTPNNTNLQWLWPTNGKIRSTFLASNPARKGISIGGKEGQAVKAAEAGVVVYSGNGLLGYGELIIIKHNEIYLSAYGHNKSLKVREGQSVNRGDTIADLGSTGTNVNNLHFEIRKNGKPVNPLNYVKP